MGLKKLDVSKFGRSQPSAPKKYADVDSGTLRPFNGRHPKVMEVWLPPAVGIFEADPHHRLTSREKKHRFMLKLEDWFGFRFNTHKHYTPVH